MLISMTEAQLKRTDGAVKWVETYRDRLMALLDAKPPSDSLEAKTQPPIRCLLLQDCYNGSDALACPLGRDGINYGFMITVLGDNQLQTSNSFKIRLYGTKLSDAPITSGDIVTIGTSGVISVISQPSDWLAPLQKITPQLDFTTFILNFGNPYYSEDLVLPFLGQQSDVSLPSSANPLPSTMLGTWFLRIDPNLFPQYGDLNIDIILDNDTSLIGLTALGVEKIYDLVGTDLTVVTDTMYRTASYPWQKGTIVQCIDFMDIGYGIIGGQTRSMNTQAPVN